MKYLILISSLFLTQISHAGILGNYFFLEPYLGYKTENTQLTDLTNNVTKINTTAPAFGLKFGVRSPIGVDLNLYGEYVSGQADISSLSEKNKFSKQSTGVQLSVNSLGFVKMYLGYALSNEFKIEESNQTSEATLKGQCYHVGLTFRLLPYLNLGVQYNLDQYNEISGPNYNAGHELSTYYSKVDTQDYMVYISSTF